MITRHDSYEGYKTNSEISDPPCIIFLKEDRNYSKSKACANWHDDLELQLCSKGSGYIIINGEKYAFKSGDIAVINSDFIHYTGSDEAISFYSVIIDSAFCRAADIDCSSIRFDMFPNDGLISEITDDILKIYYSEHTVCKKAKLQMSVLKLLITLRERHTVSQNTEFKLGMGFEQVKAAVEFIRANYDQRLTLDMIAKNALTDKYRLSHCFKAFTGLTIFQYINDYRCEVAKSLIRNGLMINEAAAQCGFNNASFFTRTFKRYTGKFPSYYKKNS